LAEVVWVRHTVGKETSDRPTVRQRVWRNIAAQAGFGNVANIDVGSLLVGFRLGVNARRAGSPVRASLRVMGHNVRVVGRERKATCNDPSNHE